jgi:CarboxypepD_reg-like domain
MFSTVCFAQFKSSNNKQLIELSGVVMSADSLRFIPFVVVNVVHKNDGTVSNSQGVFQIMIQPGDSLEFLAQGYGTKYYQIPTNLKENKYSIIQLMVQDTFYNAETILSPAPTKDEFDYAFKNWDIPDDMLETARKNTEANTLRLLAQGLPKDGRENQSVYIQQQWQRTTWQGGRPPQNIFSPMAWIDFYNAWKRGDYKRKKK